MHPKVMMEVKAIEVCPSWRSGGIAKSILEALVRSPRLDTKIIYMVGYSWTWDLDGSALTAPLYRNMLIRLFEPLGFQEFATNEPNICLRPENLFMGRIGAKVPADIVTAFKWLRLGIAP